MRRLRTVIAAALLATATLASVRGAEAIVGETRPAALTSQLPWLAPVGHRQPHQADVPQSEAVSAWERQQLQIEHDLDQRLIICHGC
jgi:hypothetical protein